MPDIITPAERDAYAAFFAAGGTITKCPTAYLAPVTGAAPLSVKSAPIDIIWRESDTSKAKAKARSEAKEHAQEFAEHERRATTGQSGRESMRAGMRAMQELRDRKMKERLMRVLRIIAGEWTNERLAIAAMEMGTRVKTLRGWLRDRGYGDKLPEQKRPVSDHVLSKRARVISLHRQGLGTRAIAESVGYRDPSMVRDIIRKWKADQLEMPL